MKRSSSLPGVFLQHFGKGFFPVANLSGHHSGAPSRPAAQNTDSAGESPYCSTRSALIRYQGYFGQRTKGWSRKYEE